MDGRHHGQPTIATGAARRRRHDRAHGAILGRSFTYSYLVTEHEPDRLVKLEVERPFPMAVRYELTDAEEGTCVAIHASGSPGRFFWWATPLMSRQGRRSISADLARLKTCLEP